MLLFWAVPVSAKERKNQAKIHTITKYLLLCSYYLNSPSIPNTVVFLLS